LAEILQGFDYICRIIMKRILTTLAVCFIPLFLDAQVVPWALFPGTGQVHTEETADTLTHTSVPDSAGFRLDIPETMELTFLLPFHAVSEPSASSYAFYSGALLAVREAGLAGKSINVNACDITDSAFPITEDILRKSDVIIGPIAEKDIRSLLPLCTDGEFIVSPLDPKAAALTDSSAVIHAPSRNEDQVKDIVKWLSEEFRPEDKVMVVSESGVPMSPSSQLLLSELAAAGIAYQNISYEVLNGLGMAETFEATATENGCTRFFIASDNEAFIGDAIRNVNLMAFKKINVTVYCTARIKSCSMIDVDSYHTVNLRMSASYFPDFESREVKNFIMAYRAIFQDEPNSFSFHGYDTARYFINMCDTYGRQWHKKLPEHSERGLQTDFRFVEKQGKGNVNAAVRRVIYNSDYSISLQ